MGVSLRWPYAERQQDVASKLPVQVVLLAGLRRHMRPDRPSGIKGEVRTKLCQARQARPTHTAAQGPEPRSHEVHFLACRSFAHFIAVRYYAIGTFRSDICALILHAQLTRGLIPTKLSTTTTTMSVATLWAPAHNANIAVCKRSVRNTKSLAHNDYLNLAVMPLHIFATDYGFRRAWPGIQVLDQCVLGM